MAAFGNSISSLFGGSSSNNQDNPNQLAVPGGPQSQSSRYNSCRDWLQEISSRQRTNVTPEIRERMQKKARRRQIRSRKVKRAKVYQEAAKMSKRAWGLGNAKAIRSAPSQMMRSAEESRAQLSLCQDVYARSRAVDYEDDNAYEEMDAMVEEQLTTLDHRQAIEAVEENVTDDNMTQILNQLRREPTNDQEMATKFALYEDFLKTVEDSREATHQFWKDCKSDFQEADGAGHVITVIENSIADIDNQENLAINFDTRNWFVYGMTVKADSNNEKLKQCLHNIEIKLELLDKDDECPFCLEKGEESVTLGCCHKACKDCWTHWQELKGMNAFCPLCRQNDFLEDMAEAEQSTN